MNPMHQTDEYIPHIEKKNNKCVHGKNKKRTGEIGTNAGKKNGRRCRLRGRREKRKNDDSAFIFFIKELLLDVFYQNPNLPPILNQLLNLVKISQDSPSHLSLAIMVYTTITTSSLDSTINNKKKNH